MQRVVSKMTNRTQSAIPVTQLSVKNVPSDCTKYVLPSNWHVISTLPRCVSERPRSRTVERRVITTIMRYKSLTKEACDRIDLGWKI